MRHKHERVGETDDFLHMVADINDRYAHFVAKAFDEWQDFGSAFDVERGQWFVHQQKARIG